MGFVFVGGVFMFATLFGVALGTFYFLMGPIEFETGKIMVEGLFVDGHDIVIAAFMIDVAAGAWFFVLTMEALFIDDGFFNHLMTLQTVFVGNTAGRLVTVEAITCF